MSNFFDQSISVILPAYNEEACIVDAVKEIDAYLQTRFTDYEILVVSEGSTDQTVAVAMALQKEVPRLKVFGKIEWTGMAGAFRTGLRQATKDIVFYTDADRQFDIRELELLLPHIHSYDIVTGYKLKRNDPFSRVLMSWIYNVTMRILFGVRVKDINCAFKLYRRAVVQSVDFVPTVTEGIVNVEIYLAARRHGYTIKEVGVHHYPRKTGSAISEVGISRHIVFVNPKVILRFIKDTISIWRKIHSL